MNKNIKFSFITLLLVFLFFISMDPNLRAQEIEPRLYQSLPIGLNAAAISYSLSHGNIVSDATAPIKNFVVTAHTFVPVYVRTFDFFGRLAKAQVILPFTYMMGDAKLSGKDTSGSRTGLADARVRFIVNILGQPTLEPKDFQGFKEETVLGASIIIGIPTGQYFEDKLVNIGSNRWSFKSEIGLSHRYGSVYFEAYAGVWLFTENNNFLKTNTLAQDPIYSFQAHLSYYFPSGIWIAVNGGYANGGETKLNDTYQIDFQNNVRMGVTFSAPLGRQHSIKALFNTGVTTRIGGDFKMLTIAYQYAWF